MTAPVPSVGDSVRSRCTKCRKVTRHLVVSVVGGAPARVECTVCEGVHNYRPAAEAAARPRATPRERATGSRTSASAAAAEKEWRARVGERNPESSVPYRTSGMRVRPGDLVNHQTFGLGVVRKVIPPDKIDVLFRDGARRLVAAP